MHTKYSSLFWDGKNQQHRTIYIYIVHSLLTFWEAMKIIFQQQNNFEKSLVVVGSNYKLTTTTKYPSAG